MTSINGIHAVLYALFDANGELDRAAMRKQVQIMLACDVDGVTVLGLATEVQKLTQEEQRNIITWVAEDLTGSCPLSVTISGNSVQMQRSLIKFALDQGADWLILQPPTAGAYSGQIYLDFFAAVASGFDAPFAIQNAPQYLGRSLNIGDIKLLTSGNSSFSLIKAEMPAIEIAGLVDNCGEALTIFNGRAGLEMTDCLRAGVKGFVLAPDVIDYSKKVFDLWSQGDVSAAEEAYREVLPAIVFMMQSIEHLICYGKRIFGVRAGIKIYDRAPAMVPSEFGLHLVNQWANQLGKFDNN